MKKHFPILHQQVNGKPLVYFDNAATTQKPQCVIDAVTHFYQNDNSNVHRGIHALSERATQAYEKSRETVRHFINAHSTDEIIFVKGTTEAINLVASSYGRSQIKAGDEIIISTMEHHSNIVPWQMLCAEVGAILKVIPITEVGELQLDVYESLLSDKTKLVAVAHASNALGTINPVKIMISMAHEKGIPVLLDGAQAPAHMAIDVQHLDCDFYTLSSHKCFGPTGVGVLYGKKELLNAMPPYQGGGDMISIVSLDHFEPHILPYKFEPGTPNISGVIGLGAALEFINHIGIDTIAQHEQQLLHYATKRLQSIPGMRFIGTAEHKCGIVSFVMEGLHPHDVGTIVDHEGVAIRTGHHCAMPLMDFYQVPATARVSFALYNTVEEIDRLVDALTKVREIML